MRAALALAALAALLLPAGAAAQEDGCVQADPCPWVLDIDEAGFVDDAAADESPLRSVGDWLQLDVQNLDERAHVLVLSGSDPPVRLEVPSLDEGGSATSPAFRFPAAGTYQLMDEGTGDSLDIVVVEGDATEVEDIADEGEDTGPGGGSGEGGHRDAADGDDDAPGLAMAVLAGGLVALAAVARRRA